MIMGDIIDNSTVKSYGFMELLRHIVLLRIVYKNLGNFSTRRINLHELSCSIHCSSQVGFNIVMEN